MSTKRKKVSLKDTLRKFKSPFVCIVFLIFAVYSATLIYALYWGMITSLKTRSNFVFDLFGTPQTLNISNYIVAWKYLFIEIGFEKRVYLPRLFLNSFIYAGGHAVICNVSTAACAYVCNKYKCKFTRFIYNLVIILMICPIVSSLGSQLDFAKKIGSYDNMLFAFWSCIGFNTANFLVLYATFATVSWNYAEAAFIDGASDFHVMTRIMFPLVRVQMMILIVMTFISFWNNYFTPLIFFPSWPTAAVALYQFQWMADTAISSIPVRMAAALLVCMPCVILFIAFRKQMVGNLTMGGLKG